MTSVLEMEWGYYGRMGKEGTARKLMKPVKKGKSEK